MSHLASTNQHSFTGRFSRNVCTYVRVIVRYVQIPYSWNLSILGAAEKKKMMKKNGNFDSALPIIEGKERRRKEKKKKPAKVRTKAVMELMRSWRTDLELYNGVYRRKISMAHVGTIC